MSHVVPLFTNLLLIIGCSLPVLFLFRRIGLPPIAGFVMTGLLIGPSGLGWVTSTEQVNSAAEIGVVLLLFSVGLEVSLSRLLKTSYRIYLLAAGQIVVTALVGFGIVRLIGLPAAPAVVIGLILAISSSAIVLKGLSDRGELETPLGRIVVTICIAQDFAVIPMLLTISFLSAGGADLTMMARSAGGVLALAGGLYVVTRYILPPVLHRLMTIDTGEIVLLFTILVMLGTAWLTSLTGLSLAIGAFAAGLILSETEYYPQIFAEVAPFRSLFASLFFVSVGMLLDLDFVLANPWPVLTVACGVLLIKALVVFLIAWLLGMPPRIGLQAGIYLAQIGEFSFLLIGAATRGSLLSEHEFQYLIAATSLTLAVTPLLMHWAPRMAWRAGRKFPLVGAGYSTEPKPLPNRPRPAVLIVGYGVNGQNVARVLREAGIYHEILESNPEIVRRAREQEELIHYGEVSRTEVLRQIEIEDFDSVVLAISDLAATRRAVSLVRGLHPKAHIIVRTRYVREVEELEKMGANVVVPEEFETSLRIFSDLLHHYRVPAHIIAMQVEAVRGHSYGILRTQAGTSVIENIQELILQRLVEAVPIMENSPHRGKRLRDLQLTDADTCLVLSVLRNGRPLRPPFEEIVLEKDDLVVLYGNHVDLVRAVGKLAGRE
ncbi:sodium:proton exchanger [candidate division KSB1 bacterium]|nr:MAG: sodium:proton exchanger [candidate division KSB1 bacterium]